MALTAGAARYSQMDDGELWRRTYGTFLELQSIERDKTAYHKRHALHETLFLQMRELRVRGTQLVLSGGAAKAL
jgi:hypothetical protein